MAAYSSSRAIFEVLREVCASPRAVGVTELSRRLQLSSSTTQRALQVLTQSEFLSRHPATPKYRSGFITERLVNALLERYPIRAVSLLPLRRLAVSSHRTASLYIRLGWYGIRVAGIEVRSDSALDHRARSFGLLSGDAPSLAILSLLSPTELERYRRFAQANAAAGLEELLGEVRARGFAYTAPGGEREIESVAIPVDAGPGITKAAIAIEGPSGARPLAEHPRREQWQDIVHEFEHTLARKAQLYADPFAHVDPDQIRLGGDAGTASAR